MRLPTIEAVIDRRILINYAIDPEVAARALPEPFRPQIVEGMAMGGLCLIRLTDMGPHGLRSLIRVSSENAAHRFAVEWDSPHGVESGVYIPRRDTNSLATYAVGGRLYPGAHHRARFCVVETAGRTEVDVAAVDGATRIQVVVEDAEELSGSALFADLVTASQFFERGSVGLSPTREAGRFDGLRLATAAWQVHAARICSVRSSFFDDTSRFPRGTAPLDSALIMRRVPVSWHPVPSMAARHV